ncbi:30S ribosomal protein S6 [Candidatus Daviesbacteria bacterium RIFCSPHIGHO2_02_FULL_39_12]|uniref:Small ribosomal subunit protein bS6 n=1 Tax=Candidatus Daviesbacteria bacterium RIFCSPHIGHO2_02_FULL_39_12 TaxID=1797770 RepID=A0A1F5J913_9BACT|nr:MAG: 30S ribosomal protein S6 [Candidatus Daviesbacteria bacterium RIFCSPHIGHO2_02_FULL_39_12]
MNSYYLTLVLKVDLEDKEKKALLDSITKKLLGEDGKMEKEDIWGSKDLAYPIKRQTKGDMVHFEITADPKNAKAIDKTLKLEEDILRYLLVRVKGQTLHALP